MKKTYKLLSILLALAMVIGMLPMSALTTFAAEPTEITEIKTKMSVDTIPKAGMEVRSFMPNVPDGEPYERDWDGAEWYDSEGVMIAPTLNHHYDIGYEFEAGRTYYADYQYTADDGYLFAQDPTITLTGPDPSMFTYEIVDRWANNRSVTVRYTFTIPGEIDYPDINKVSMMYYGTAAENYKMPEACELIYNNCTITREEWNTGTWGSEANWGVYEEDGSNAPTFLAGESYVHMVELTAKEGYKFSAGLHVQKGTQDAEEYGIVSLSDDRTVATVKFTYNIGAYEIIDTVELVAANQHVNFMLRSGESIYLPQPFGAKYSLADDCPYAPDGGSNYTWVIDETGEHLHLGYPHSFEVGKTYTLSFAVRIKDEFKTTHKFAKNPTLDVSGYTYANSDIVKFKISGSGQIVNVYVTFTAQFPKNAGNSAYNPAICNSYWEFKYAMENEDIRYVALGDINETLPVGKEGLVTAIHVNGIKNLHLLGDATFTAPAMTETTYAALLHTTQNTTLNISGTGSLTFKAVANNSYNAVIYNQGGWINVDSGTLIGSYNTAVYGSAIWQEYGELRIKDGQFFADNAMAPLSLPTPMSAVIVYGGQAWIEGGTFRMRNWVTTIDQPYGLQIGKDATVDLSGGIFYGIKLPTDSTPLANYMDEDFYTALTNESKFNPESVYSQQHTASGNIVRIVWLVDHVDVHINEPAAGVDITENYFNIPTSGCQATMYYPQWYKNGEIVTHGTFEAGASYKVVVQIEVKPGYGAEFTSGVTAALNNKSVTVKRLSAHWIEIEYDFGECPNLISLVELTATAPKEGQKPSYTIGLGSNAYKLVGNYNNYKDYRQWYMSSDGDEWWPINENHTFMSGYYYKLYVDIQTASGYEFPLIDNGTIQPDVSATVNGYYARVIKAYDQDPSAYITVEYDFGMCNDSIVEQIAVVDVAAPVAGERPNYTYNILGSGYQMNTAKNAYKDIYWTNPTEKWYYIKNGIGWYDLTEEDWVYENERFIAGHQYEVTIYLITEDGYEFAHNKWYEPTVTATVNGNSAEAVLGGSDCTGAQQIEYTFTCEKKDVSTVILYGLDAPQGDKIPDREITTAYPELYTVEYVAWYDREDNMLLDEDTFRSGERYKVEIKIVPTQIGGVNASQFVSPVKAYIDGQEVTERLNWDAVYASANAVYVYYTFIKGAAAPDVPIIPIVNYGDCNDDGKINGRDYALLLQHINGWDVVINTDAADVNADGKINGRDYALLLQYINGWDVKLGPQS